MYKSLDNTLDQPLISVIIPMYNEAANVLPVYRAVRAVMRGLACRFEILFVDDGSNDDTPEELVTLADEDPRVVPVELARNFGKEIALTAGLRAARGDAAIMLDADLQHPPERIPEFIRKWEGGADLVIGVRREYKTSRLKRVLSRTYYKLINRISDIDLVPNATDYRLVDRQVVGAFNQFTEHSRITRGLFDWLGFKRDYIYFDAEERQNGQASYSFKKLLKLALDSFVGHTLLPLRLAGYIGMLMMIVTLPLGIFILIDSYVFHYRLFHLVFSGTAILAVVSLFLSGLTLTCLGLIALYIENIHQEVVNRPLFVTRPLKRQSRNPRRTKAVGGRR